MKQYPCENKPTNTFVKVVIRRHAMKTQVLGFKCLKIEYITYLDFAYN